MQNDVTWLIYLRLFEEVEMSPYSDVRSVDIIPINLSD
jgi:hypothetical protein